MISKNFQREKSVSILHNSNYDSGKNNYSHYFSDNNNSHLIADNEEKSGYAQPLGHDQDVKQSQLFICSKASFLDSPRQKLKKKNSLFYYWLMTGGRGRSNE